MNYCMAIKGQDARIKNVRSATLTDIERVAISSVQLSSTRNPIYCTMDNCKLMNKIIT